MGIKHKEKMLLKELFELEKLQKLLQTECFGYMQEFIVNYFVSKYHINNEDLEVYKVLEDLDEPYNTIEEFLEVCKDLGLIKEEPNE